MKRLVLIFLALALVFFLGACERQETQTPGQQGVEKTPPPATVQPPGETTQREPAGTSDQTTSTAGQPSGMQEQPATTQAQQPGEQSTAMQPSGSEQAAGQSGQKPGGQEFLGQSPEFGNAPETIVLQAKNGNVTLPHKAHAEMMDCKTCHGDSPPGLIEGFSKDQAHALCQGCHKEKGAGPTKCQECHKKS